MAEACTKVQELAVLAKLPIDDKIHHMAVGVRTVQEEALKAQWELNLQIA